MEVADETRRPNLIVVPLLCPEEIQGKTCEVLKLRISKHETDL